tara:strand:+ start:455 stop:874 length:420 start_codon:yes stop_codon:yes gene_type:complete
MGYNINLEKIFNKFPKDKIELKKIELSLVDDFKKQINNFKEFNSETKKLIALVNKTTKANSKDFKSINKIKDVLQKTEQTALEIEDEGNDVLGNLIDSADALGVNPQAVEGYNELFSLQSEIGQAIFDANDWMQKGWRG